MYNVGVLPGKFFPPHRGHLFQIINASTMCKKLYVVVSDSETLAKKKCEDANIPFMSLYLRTLWLSIELQAFEHIEVITIDESNIPTYPHGSKEWSDLLLKVMHEKFDAIFGGEQEYIEIYKKYFPNATYEMFDYKRSRYAISGTVIRDNPLNYWNYILGSARSFFAKRVLITGTESCAKSTLTQYLAKIFHTSWSEEYGRYYANQYLGGNESLFQLKDFERIAHGQATQDIDTLKNANKIAFFDTDAVVTQYYCEMFTGSQNSNVESFVNPEKYDLVFFMAPTVKWVPDGQRFKSDQRERGILHEKLYNMYVDRGFKDKIIEINDPNYTNRLKKAIDLTDGFLSGG